MKSCPASFLWGCSSAKLYTQGVHDRCGRVLNYLTSGSPFVIGNLWDVTDVDIDKLSMSCMGTALGTGSPTDITNVFHSTTVASSLVEARSVCKLKCAVGYAPVMYGLPARISSL